MPLSTKECTASLSIAELPVQIAASSFVAATSRLPASAANTAFFEEALEATVSFSDEAGDPGVTQHNMPLNSPTARPTSLERRVKRMQAGLAVLEFAWSGSVMPQMPQGPCTQARSFHLDAPLARVFPLFTAVGEKAWVPGWEPEILSGREERGSVFRTVHGGHVTTWIVVDYRPSEGRASYARLAHGSSMGLVDVHCSASPGGGTDVSVRYTLTGLDAEGKAFVAGFLQPEQYSRMIEEWRTSISAALAANT